jgi:hypothetical protein
MTDKPPIPEDDSLPEAEADARFNRLLGNLVNTPHTPHKQKGSGDERDSAQTAPAAPRTG